MRRTITWQLGKIIAIVILLSLVITSAANFLTSYNKVLEAAGIEAVGCANITTGLLKTDDIDKIIKGDTETAEKLGKSLGWTVAHKDIFKASYVLSLDGKILALDDNLKAQGYKVGDAFYLDKDLAQEMIDTKHPQYSDVYEFGDMKRLTGYAPIFKNHDPTKEIIAFNAIDFDGNIAMERTWEMVSSGMLLSIVPMGIACVINIWAIRRRTKPLTSLIEQAKKLADGELTVEKVHVKNNDEIRDLADNLHAMAENLNHIVGTIKDTSSVLTANARETSDSLDEMKTTMHQINRNIEEVANGATEGKESTHKSADGLDELSKMVQFSKEKAEISNVNSKETLKTAEAGMAKVTETSIKMEAIKEATLETEETIKKLSDYSKQIQVLADTITNIAEQTNLLALNASIEAARAGENGRGFAVVADEVRKLAEQANLESTEVVKIVYQISKGTEDTVSSIQTSRKNVDEGEQLVKETGNAFKDILQAVEKTVREIEDISKLSNEQADTSDRLVQLVKELAGMVENVAANSQEVSASAEETSASIDEIAHRSNETKKIAESLTSIVDKFKI